MLPHILIVVKKSDVRQKLKAACTNLDAITTVTKSSKRLWDRLSKGGGDFIFISRDIFPEPIESSVKLLKEAPEAPEIIVVTEDEVAEERAQLIAAGCDEVLPEAIDVDLFGEIFASLVEKRKAHAGLQLTAKILMDEPRLSDFVSESASMRAFMEVVDRVVQSNTSLLILGETGVGEERLAKAIHSNSLRSSGTFVPINCAALPESLLESELFGHEEGSFTGASRRRRGWFELAHGGTVFLDEIGEMPLHLQVKLLRVLQDRELFPIGSERSIPIDVRVMAATNRDLEEAAKNGEFRKDLFYRLSVVTLTLPPLRERREDIPTLVINFLDYFQTSIRSELDGIDQDAMDALVAYSWPGNVRELSNVIERTVLLCKEPKVTVADLPRAIVGESGEISALPPVLRCMGTSDAAAEKQLLDRSLREVRQEAVAHAETAYIRAMLQKTRGRINETAKLAGIQTRSLFEKMRRYGIQKEEFRAKKPS